MSSCLSAQHLCTCSCIHEMKIKINKYILRDLSMEQKYEKLVRKQKKRILKNCNGRSSILNSIEHIGSPWDHWCLSSFSNFLRATKNIKKNEQRKFILMDEESAMQVHITFCLHHSSFTLMQIFKINIITVLYTYKEQ